MTLLTGGGENDPDAVKLCPRVALVTAKSNPLGNAAAQTQFNEGDIITITDNSDDEVYTYQLGADDKWKPTDGKYLLWHDGVLDIEAFYGETGAVADQSDAAKFSSADYMIFAGQVTRPSGSNELAFDLERKNALVTVKIASCSDAWKNRISGLSVNGIQPFIRDASGNFVSSTDNGTVGYSYSAILQLAQQTSIDITYGAEQNAIRVNNDFLTLKEGKSYTINLHVGDDTLELGDITVSDWGNLDSEEIILPYITFSAQEEQVFKMDFASFYGEVFSLGENEYFEYSIGDGNWVRFTTTVSDIAFGGGKGNLRLRGKSSKGTASSLDGPGTTISFSNEVPVRCTGDIRTLIDYERYKTVSTKDARFCMLFKKCTSLTTAPELPATDLAEFCYADMFSQCSKLSTVKMLATNVEANRCLHSWLSGSGTSATSRTLTLANADIYDLIYDDYLPENWRQGAENTSVNFMEN
ncbi:MAG: fimbrillin family protein [Candidatus Cryptobacteroides sp.]